MMGLTIQPETLAVLCIGLWHWVQLNDVHNYSQNLTVSWQEGYWAVELIWKC
jgi:hypothetical protein